MASKSLQIVPAGARQVAPGVYQMSRRRGHGGGGRHHRGGKHKRHSVSEFNRPWVKNAIAASVGEGLIRAWGLQLPAWVDPRALALYLYGNWKNNRSAIAAAKTMQGAYLAAYKGVPSIVSSAVRASGMGGGMGLFPGESTSIETPMGSYHHEETHSGGVFGEIERSLAGVIPGAVGAAASALIPGLGLL